MSKYADRNSVTFILLWAFVICVSVLDGYLVFRHRDDILMFELNPVGHKLIEWNDGQVSYLLFAKFTGTVAVGAVLLLIYKANSRIGVLISLGLAAFQLALLMFLLFN